MKNLTRISLGMALLLAIPTLAVAGDKPSDVDTHMNALSTMCSESADARASRQAEKSLYERLGGYDKINALMAVLVHNHAINPDFAEMMKTIDHERLILHVTDFVAAGTGGTAKYTGRGLRESHERFEFGDAEFLSAGADVVKSMQVMGYGQNEIDEFVCILVSMKDQVVLK